MLTLYRRHTPDCSFFGKKRHAKGANACANRCPVWVQGTLRGERIRRSLDLNSWQAASDLVRGWEVSGAIGVVKPEIPTVKEAISKFFADAEARHLSKSTIDKQKNILEKRLLPWTEKHGCRLLKTLDVDALRRFRATWPDSAVTASKNLERLRNFFRFCVDSKWLDSNPAKAVKAPKVTQIPTLPFEDAEWKKLIDACDRISLRGPYRDGKPSLTWRIYGGGPLQLVDPKCEVDYYNWTATISILENDKHDGSHEISVGDVALLPLQGSITTATDIYVNGVLAKKVPQLIGEVEGELGYFWIYGCGVVRPQ